MPFVLENGKTIAIKSAQIRNTPSGTGVDRKRVLVSTAENSSIHLYVEKTRAVWRLSGARCEGECPFCGCKKWGEWCKGSEEAIEAFANYALAHPSIRLKASLIFKPRRF